MTQVVVNEPNRWRLESPGASSWQRSARPDAAKKYFMVSADGHANEPANLWVERIDAKYKDRLPRVITDKDGVQWRVSEGHRPDRLRQTTHEGWHGQNLVAGSDLGEGPPDRCGRDDVAAIVGKKHDGVHGAERRDCAHDASIVGRNDCGDSIGLEAAKNRELWHYP